MIQKYRTLRPWGILLSFALLFASGCTDSTSPDTDPLAADKRTALQGYASIVYATYTDALSSAKTMQQAIQTFITTPTEANLNSAKAAWLEARQWYGQTEAFRFYGGPIDGENGPEGALNSWPLDESYIDYVEGNPNSGIINNLSLYPSISKNLLEELNEKNGETNISLGYHAIEFLLWGQDRSAPSAKQPGQRPLSDYTSSSSAERRKQYLLLATELLVENLERVTKEWEPSLTTNYRSSFLAAKSDSSLKNVLQGLASLSGGELSGERMEVALGKGDQEDEHSCFSDNTHNDIRANLLGILNIWKGIYLKRDGSTINNGGIAALIQKKDASAEQRLGTDLVAATTAAAAIQPPFDYEISSGNFEGNQRVNTAIQATRKVSHSVVHAAEVLGYLLNIE